MWKPSIDQINCHHHSIKEFSSLNTNMSRKIISPGVLEKPVLPIPQIFSCPAQQFFQRPMYSMVDIKEGKTKKNVIPNQMHIEEYFKIAKKDQKEKKKKKAF